MTTHPIYALWCHPRSRSTALERAMMERGDLVVLHEPFSVSYYLEHRPDVPHLEVGDDQPRTYAKARALVLERAEQGPLLLKEMPYHGGERLLQDSEFLSRLQHAFLIRDPALSIPSHFALDPDLRLEEVGLEACWHLFRRVSVSQTAAALPPVVDAEVLAARPEPTFEALCRALDLGPRPEALEWRAGAPDEWNVWSDWHTHAASSSGIHAQTSEYETTIENSARLRRLWRHHLPFYEKLARETLEIS